MTTRRRMGVGRTRLQPPGWRHTVNAALIVGRLKPFAERTSPDLKVNAVIARVAAQTAIPAAHVIPFNLPPIMGLGTGSGFEYQLEDQQGGHRRNWRQ